MNLEMVKVVCESCGDRYHAPKGTVWPIACRHCTCDTAPSWWFRENNPDQKRKVGVPEDGQ